MPLDSVSRSELARLEACGRRLMQYARSYRSDALLLLADAAEELAQVKRLDEMPEAAAAVARMAAQFRSLAPIVAAP